MKLKGKNYQCQDKIQMMIKAYLSLDFLIDSIVSCFSITHMFSELCGIVRN